MEFYAGAGRKATASTPASSGARRVLVSPEFLFRVERDPAAANAGALPDQRFELASRLSFFLWSSIPDDELLDVGRAGQLKQPAVLEQQVRRMLADPRADALVDNFAGQWLLAAQPAELTRPTRSISRISTTTCARRSSRRPSSSSTASCARTSSVARSADADYTFVNERLARHYGIPNVYGSHFRRVTLTDEAAAGLLGQGSILTVTSYPNRTSPVLRGKWLLENILGTPPPPPPPNVPALEENDDGAAGRSRCASGMEQHRKNPACASCHARMDPLGFALENFDAIGQWRTTTKRATPIDASGVAARRHQGSRARRRCARRCSRQRDEFVANGDREAADLCARPGRRVLRRAGGPPDRAGRRGRRLPWSALILGIVKSTPFQMRNVEIEGVA